MADIKQVILREKRSGTRVKFFLDSESRVTVDTVLQALGAGLVMLDDGDGSFSVLERNPSGKSLNVFKPGEIVDVIAQQQPQPSILPHVQAQPGPSNLAQFSSGTNWPPQLEVHCSELPRLSSGFSTRYELDELSSGFSLLRSRYKLDVDDPCVYLDCQYVHEIDLRVHVCTKVFIWPEIKSGTLSDRQGDPQIELVKYLPPTWGCREDENWDELYSGKEHFENVRKIESWMGLATSKSHTWKWLTDGRKVDVKKVFDYQIVIGTKNNEVLADYSSSSGLLGSAVLGVNIYKRLTWPAILRTHLEYLLWAVTSQLPYMQLVTDMRTGGLFYACNGEAQGMSDIWIVVMQDMDQVKQVFQQFGKNLPKSEADFTPEERVRLKTIPPRAKFPHKGARHPAVKPAFA